MHVAIIGLGEAGALYARGLTQLGWTVAGFDPAYVPTPEGVTRKSSPVELVDGADAVLCLVGGRAAVPAASSVAEHLQESTTFIDMNSASAAVKLSVADVVGTDRYADVAVIGSVPEHGAATPVAISGTAAEKAAEVFTALGAPVEVVGDVPGDAAKRKLLRSSFMKGLGALIVETLNAGEAMGAREWILEQMSNEHSGGTASVQRLYDGTVKHAVRRGHEAQEAAEMLESVGAQSTMSRAAAESHALIGVAAKLSKEELVKAYSTLPAANIGDARERMGMVDGGIKALFPSAKAVGWARTVNVAAGDNKVLHQALEHIHPGDFLVVNGQGYTDRALMGELMAEKAKARGAVGIIADGALRDIQDLEEMGFSAWARAANPSGPYKNGPGAFNVPVAVGRVVVNPGDLIVADQDGVIVVPAAEVAETLPRAQAVQQDEAERRKKILGGDLS